MSTCGNCGGSGVSYFTGSTCMNCKGSGQDPTGEPADWLFGSSKKKSSGCSLWLILAMLAAIVIVFGGMS